MYVIATAEAEVHSSSVSLPYVIHLCILFSKAAFQKRGSMEPIESHLDPPLSIIECSMRGHIYIEIMFF